MPVPRALAHIDESENALLRAGAPSAPNPSSELRPLKFWLHELKAATWNVRSLWANESVRIFRCIENFSGQLDLLVLTETRESQERKSAIPTFVSFGWEIFSSGIDARSGGIAIWVKKSFLCPFFLNLVNADGMSLFLVDSGFFVWFRLEVPYPLLLFTCTQVILLNNALRLINWPASVPMIQHI